MRILVSGSTGYVGKRLINQLIKSDSNAIGLAGNTKVSSLGNSLRLSDFEEGIKKFCPEVVVNLAANVSKEFDKKSIEEILVANVAFPQRLALSALDAGCTRFINVSTYSIFADDGTYRPETYYAASKKANEDLLEYFHQNTKMKVLNLVFYDIYGPDQPHGRLLPKLVAAMKDGEEFHLSPGEQEINLLFVDDAVSGIISAIQNPDVFSLEFSSKFCLYSADTVKVKMLSSLITEALGFKSETIYYDAPYRHNQIMNFSPKNEMLPNWQPQTELKTGLVKSFGSKMDKL